MRNSQRYRHNAAERQLAAYDARQPCYGKLDFSMATLYPEFRRQDDAMDNLLASWDMAEPIKTDGLVLSPSYASANNTTNFPKSLGHIGAHQN